MLRFTLTIVFAGVAITSALPQANVDAVAAADVDPGFSGPDDHVRIPICRRPNEVFHACSPRCERVCGVLVPAPSICLPGCVRACQCKPGYIRQKVGGLCVKECPRRSTMQLSTILVQHRHAH